jgi:hypothetical protein
MTQPGGHSPQSSHRVASSDGAASGTSLGADTTARMSGTQQVVRPTGTSHTGPTHAKTSAAAVFALVFGLAALFCALTAILSPAAVLFGVIGIVLGIVGLKMAKRVGVTGRGVAIGGLVTAVLGLLLGGAVLGGLSALVNDESRLDQLQNQIDDLRDDVPSTGEIRNEIEPS